MRWKLKSKQKPDKGRNHKDGNRYYPFFAILPCITYDNYMIWLEKAYKCSLVFDGYCIRRWDDKGFDEPEYELKADYKRDEVYYEIKE